MARPPRYRQQYQYRSNVVQVYQNVQPQSSSFSIQYSTLQRFFPDFISQYPFLYQGLSLDQLGLEETDISHDWAWYLIFKHISAYESGKSSSELGADLESWLGLGPWVQQHLTDQHGLPNIIRAMGDLLSFEVLGCPSSLFGSVATFLTRNLTDLLLTNPYVVAASVSAMCDMLEDNQTRLQRLVMLIKSVPNAEDVIWWAVADPGCQACYPISDELQAALQLQGQRSIPNWLPPPQNPQWQYQRPFRPRNRQRLALPSEDFFPPNPGQLSLPPVRRPAMHGRTRSTPSIKGSHLSPSVLLNVAYNYPDRVKVDSRVFMNSARSMGWPGIGPQRLLN